MKTKLSLLTLGLSAIVASSAFAGDIRPLHAETITRTLGSAATATDIIKMTCGVQAGINQATVRIWDYATVAKPVMQVQIAPWTGSACGTYTTAVKDGTTASGDADSTWSANTASVSATSGGFYCVKVSKVAGHQNNAALPDQADIADDYRLDHHCYNSSSPNTHPASNTGTYLQNQ